MKKIITRTLLDFRLWTQFVARKFGIPGRQIHQICLPDEKLIYIPIPKNACTTVKQVLHQIEFGRVFNANHSVSDPYVDVHDYYLKRRDAFTGNAKLNSASDYTRFTVVRDPVERLISCYRNRVVDLRDLQSDTDILRKKNLSAEPDLEEFVLNLKQYRNASKSIEHHTRPQSLFLGGTLQYFDNIYPFECLNELHDFLRTFSPQLKLLTRKSGGTQVDASGLSDEALASAVQYYERDYTLLSTFYRPNTKMN